MPTEGIIAGIMVLKAREKHRIPLSVMDTIINDVQSLFDVVISKLSAEVQKYLQHAGTYQENLRGVNSIFTNYPQVLQTQHHSNSLSFGKTSTLL